MENSEQTKYKLCIIDNDAAGWRAMCSLCDDGRDGMTCTERTESDETERNGSSM